jgi:hypothetical protein
VLGPAVNRQRIVREQPRRDQHLAEGNHARQPVADHQIAIAVLVDHLSPVPAARSGQQATALAAGKARILLAARQLPGQDTLQPPRPVHQGHQIAQGNPQPACSSSPCPHGNGPAPGTRRGSVIASADSSGQIDMSMAAVGSGSGQTLTIGQAVNYNAIGYSYSKRNLTFL